MKVYLGGEGPDDLGDHYHEPQYRSSPLAPGLIETLLRRAAKTDFTIAGASVWKRIRKFRFGRPLEGETRSVLGLMIEAEEVGADVLVFVRDQDGYRDREEAITEGLRLAREPGRFSPAVVGGVAVQEIEAWILALLGDARSERHADAKTVLADKHSISDRAAKIAAVETADLTKIPRDAASLADWLSQVTATFVMRS